MACDFSKEEILIAAHLSGEKGMLAGFEEEKYIPLLDSQGQPVYNESKQVFYKNPRTDIYVLTAATCCFPELFKDRPQSDWDSIARDSSQISIKGTPRDYGKRTALSIIYRISADALARNCFVPVDEAKKWLELHKKEFPDFHAWSDEQAAWAEARGFTINQSKRIRWVAEDNSKAAGASPARSGVNFCVQGLGADILKRVLVRIRQVLILERIYQGLKPIILHLPVHDEFLASLPGSCTVNTQKSIWDATTGLFKPKFDPASETQELANIIKNIMETSEAEVLGYPRGFAEVEIAPYWQH
jgi:DNA polymerase I-like protein with 3'-5' exonuclease and polymerase domains